MPEFNITAIVLRRIPYGETDNILTLYAVEQGRMSVIAKGARRSNSKLRGASEILTCSRMNVATGKSSLFILTQAEVRHSYSKLRSDLFRLTHAQYLAEIVEKSASENDPHPEVFSLLRVALLLLERIADPEMASRWFELRFLEEAGYAPSLDSCAICGAPIEYGAPDASHSAAISIALGGVLCAKHEMQSPPRETCVAPLEALTFLQRLNAISTSDVRQMLLEPAPSPDASRAARIALARFIREHTETELKSAAFLESLR